MFRPIKSRFPSRALIDGVSLIALAFFVGASAAAFAQAALAA